MAKAIIEGQSGGQSSEIAFEDEDGNPIAREEIAELADPALAADDVKKDAVRADGEADQW